MTSISKSTVLLALTVLGSGISTSSAIGYNGRIDLLQTVNHKEEIESLLNKRYSGDSAPQSSMRGDIDELKKILKKENSEDDNESRNRISRRAFVTNNGYMRNSELDNVVTNIVEASEIVERQSMI